MSYIALARKYRPNNFAELIGQKALTITLSHAILEGRMHHAFLLTGIRGIGKTTTARIIAKNLNCEKGETTEPCEICISCVAIKQGNHPDVIEFDAASNTSIEDIKIIISNTHYAPVMSRKKVFIIDEIHMLSTKAFNALLKTLEEPPANIVFIFATTESRKVPITILSRCQKFFLKAVKEEEIELHLEEILKKEGFQAEKEAIKKIAEKAGGSIRDALSILDQAILNISNDKFITFEDIKNMLKIPTEDETDTLFNLVLAGETENTIKTLENLLASGLDELEIIADLINLIAKKIKQEAIGETKIGIPNLIRFYQILIKGSEDIKFTENKKIAIEVLIIKLIFSWKLPSPMEVLQRIKEGETKTVLSIFEDARLIDTK